MVSALKFPSAYGFLFPKTFSPADSRHAASLSPTMLVEIFFASFGLLLFFAGMRLVALAGYFPAYKSAHVCLDRGIVTLIRSWRSWLAYVRRGMLWLLLVIVHRITVFSLRTLSYLEGVFAHMSRRFHTHGDLRDHTVKSITPLFLALRKKGVKEEKISE